MENNTEVETLSDPVPLESNSESEGEESETANNLGQHSSNEDWLRYAVQESRSPCEFTEKT